MEKEKWEKGKRKVGRGATERENGRKKGDTFQDIKLHSQGCRVTGRMQEKFNFIQDEQPQKGKTLGGGKRKTQLGIK